MCQNLCILVSSDLALVITFLSGTFGINFPTFLSSLATFSKEVNFVFVLGSATTFKTFEDWYSEPIPDETKRLFERASQKLTLLMEHEEKLVVNLIL